MLLRPETRQIFVDLDFSMKMCLKLKSDNRDDEFLVSRIIFLTTYNTNIDIESLIDHRDLATIICANIGRHAKPYVTKQKKVRELDPMENMALVETLKLLFNIAHFCPQRMIAFSPALPHLLVLLAHKPIISSKPFDAPIGQLINALLNIDLSPKDNVTILFAKGSSKGAHGDHVFRLIDILEKGINAYQDDDLEQNVSPLLTLLRKIYPLAPREVQSQMHRMLLPSAEDRKGILGRGTSLPSRLLRLSTNPMTPQVRETASTLLFELSDMDAQKFVRNVGYGFASGFLFQHNLQVPQTAGEAWSLSDSASGSSGMRGSHDSGARGLLEGRVNPVTGQLLDMEAQVEDDEMTQEEKEMEAEKLFVLFERYVFGFLFPLHLRVILVF